MSANRIILKNMPISDRQKNLLNIIVSEYNRSAEPVGSKFLAGTGRFDLSPATLRNEMADLEKEGYIYQPHTSAGRVPTEKGYRFFINNFLKEKELGRREREVIRKELSRAHELNVNVYKILAKTLAEITPVAVIFAFSKNDHYYTGLSNLFSQPEFSDMEIVRDISAVIDRMDEVLNDVFSNVGAEVEILLGKENPFGEACGTLITSYDNKKKKGVMGFLGPMRMDYQANYSLIKYSKELINDF